MLRNASFQSAPTAADTRTTRAARITARAATITSARQTTSASMANPPSPRRLAGAAYDAGLHALWWGVSAARNGRLENDDANQNEGGGYTPRRLPDRADCPMLYSLLRKRD